MSTTPGFAARILIAVVQIYRLVLSPLLPPSCRFEPSCSRYALAALREHGAARGGWLSIRRLFRCRPGGGSGYDPVPPRLPATTGRGGATR